MLASLMKSSDLVPTCTGPARWEESSTQEQWCMPALLFLEKIILTFASPGLTVKLVNSVSPCMSLVHFELLSLHWSLEQARLWGNESMHGPFKTSSALFSHSFLSLWDTLPTGFTCYRDFSFWYRCPVLERVVWCWDTSLLRGKPHN